jgi:hypothetical protein
MPHRIRPSREVLLKTVGKLMTFANVISLTALFVALGGTSYAVTRLDKNSVKSKHIVNGQVKKKDLGASAVDSARVKNLSLLGEDVAPLTITAANLADTAVTTGKLADNAVTTGKLANNAVTTGKLADTAVTTGKLADNSVATGKVANGTLLKEDVAGGQFLGATVTVQRTDIAVNDGALGVSASTECPAGQRIIGGSANISDAASTDVNITVSRPAGPADSLPNSGDGFDRWRGVASNPAGGTGNTTMRVWAICAS